MPPKSPGGGLISSFSSIFAPLWGDGGLYFRIKTGVLFKLNKRLEKIIDMHTETSDYSTKLWNLLFLEEWLKSHYDSIPSQ